MAENLTLKSIAMQDFTNDNNGPDRVLVLKPMAGKTVIDTTGNMDKRLFTGDNKLHVLFENGQLWRLKFEHGDVPPPLRQKFTSFSIALKTAREYYAKRNVQVDTA